MCSRCTTKEWRYIKYFRGLTICQHRFPALNRHATKKLKCGFVIGPNQKYGIEVGRYRIYGLKAYTSYFGSGYKVEILVLTWIPLYVILRVSWRMPVLWCEKV